jgi:hypothetical protein
MAERIYTATQQEPPAGPWHIRIQQDNRTLEDDCDHDHRAGAREDLERRFDAMMAMECE